MFDFTELTNIVTGEEWEEKPVDLETFAYSKDFLGLPPLSDPQKDLIRATSQILKRETLHNLYGYDEGERLWKWTFNEIIFQLGKGSGKDYCSSIACAYIVYLLLCLKEPAEYYGRPAGDDIAILNVAINAAQANNVFFKNFINRIERCPWFEGKFDKKAGEIAFDKNVTVFSGHSEREAWEGYNVLVVILDEIAGFALESASGNEQAKTADAIYQMYRGSVSSRYGEWGKLVLLSFPRFKGDYIQQAYDRVVRDKEVITKQHTFKLDPDLPDGIEDNEFTIEWEEDHIVSYTTPRVYALKRPTWDINPLKTIDSYTRDFYDNPSDALGRVACMPPDAVDAFFKDKRKIEEAFNSTNGVREDGTFEEFFVPDPTKKYFVHVDLARLHDRCAVTLAHVESWGRRKIGRELTEAAPYVKVDALRYWTPTKQESVDFIKVREYIVSLRDKGFDIKLVTFDRWESYDMMEYLKGIGMPTERLSVAKKHYEDMAFVVQENRLEGPDNEILRKELLTLRIMPNDKIDHPRKGSKDLADATCGAVYNAIAHTARPNDETNEIVTLTEFKKQHRDELRAAERPVPRPPINPPSVKEMPPELREWLVNVI
jgi:hypothetical protein